MTHDKPPTQPLTLSGFMRVKHERDAARDEQRLREAILAHREATRSNSRAASINARLWDAVERDDDAP